MSKKNDTWMPLYIGDYLADTSRLSTEQHGAYLLILMDYWRNGPPLDEDEELASITKLSASQWRKHASKLRAMFQAKDGRLTQKRADEERQRAGLISGKRSEAGKAGAAAKWGKACGKPIANAMANAMANVQQNDGPSQSQIPNTEPPSPDGDDPPSRNPPKSKPIERPESVDAQVWADWLALRKAKKAPVTATVLRSAEAEAVKAGLTTEAFLRVWCARGSQGLEAEWLKPHERSGPQQASETAWQRSQRERVEKAMGVFATPRTQQQVEVLNATPIALG